VREQHRAGELQLLDGAAQLPERRRRIVERQRRQRRESRRPLLNDAREIVVDDARKSVRDLRRLDVRAGCGQRYDLRINAVVLEHPLSGRDVAMPGDGDVVVAGIVDFRIPLGVVFHGYAAFAALQGVEVRGGIEVIVDVYDAHEQRLAVGGSRWADYDGFRRDHAW